MNNKLKFVLGSTAFIVITTIILLASLGLPKTSSQIPQPSARVSVSDSPSSVFKDGSYSSEVTYEVHRIPESIQVNVTMAKNTINQIKVQNSTNDQESAQYQSDFEKEIKQSAIGQNISNIQISRISGASDTIRAFLSAINKIKSEAKI